MTRESFRKTAWTGGMHAVHQGELYMIANCDFEEYTVGLVKKEGDKIMEVPCEEVEIQKIQNKTGIDTGMLRKNIDTTKIRLDRLVPEKIKEIVARLSEEGGRSILVGGAVRDAFVYKDSKDLDIEVFGIDPDKIEKILAEHGPVSSVGKSFGVIKFSHEGEVYDFSLPRKEVSTGEGHTSFDIETDPNLSFAEAAQRRDFTMNAIGYDILEKELLDPYNGIQDIKNNTIRTTSDAAFDEDPLRVLRMVQFASRFEMDIDPKTWEQAKKAIDEGKMDSLSSERVWEEFKKMMLMSKKPSVGWEIMKDIGILERNYPELFDIIGVEQSPEWHPEGDVWVHTMMCVDVMREELENRDKEMDNREKLKFLYAILCHDLGKTTHTTIDEEGKIKSIGHEEAGIEPTKSFMKKITREKEFVKEMLPLIEHHVKPGTFYQGKAKANAIRRLSTKVNLKDLAFFAKVDNFGRTTEAARKRKYPAETWLIEEAEKLNVSDSKPKPILMGKDLIKMGIKPSPEFKKILDDVFERQIEGELATTEEAIAFVIAKIKINIPSVLEDTEEEITGINLK